MQPLRVYSVVPRLPERLKPLWDLAYNTWFSWNSEITELFNSVDPVAWRESHNNPVAFLNQLPQKTLEQLATDNFFVERVREAKLNLTSYLSKKSMPIGDTDVSSPVVAYFSLEYGVAWCLPIYSGGLGILAGDHLKSASDLSVPLVAVGLLYQQGYFRQYLTPDGWQQERYPIYDYEQMPAKVANDPTGKRILVSVDLAGTEIFAQIWEVAVGRVRLFLLDTNIAENQPHHRSITAKLYGGNLEMRLWQEILLGIGGIRALTAMGIAPKVVHMNEGHSAFAGLERIRRFMEDDKLSFEAAAELAAGSSIFTTHTPVPAGNDRFPPELMQPYFDDYARKLGLAFKVFLALGREDIRNDAEPFCMTVLALRLSRFNNGVSVLHGEVSRNMWKKVWPQYPVADVPIGSVTNGIHVPTWLAPDIATLYDRYLGSSWREDPDCNRVYEQTENISDAELWRTHERLRERLVDFARRRLRDQLVSRGAKRRELEVAEEVLSPTTLTIGFARRFATYKRAGLIMKDPERLIKLIKDTQRPVQFIFAGKAHPQDNEGKKLIQQLVAMCNTADCRYSMVFLEDYDFDLAKYMYHGCDIWLNNPRRPLEACGTSGMKAMCNGVLNLSIPDGWWDEAWQPDNSTGWTIGQGEEYDDPEYQDFVESQTLYNIIESEIAPLFYERGHGNLPRGWIKKMKAGLRHLGPVFNSHRMVMDYVRHAYQPALSNYDRLVRNDYSAAKDLAAWRMDMMTKWSSLDIRNIEAAEAGQVYVDEAISVKAEVYLNGIKAENVNVEIYAGAVDYDNIFSQRLTMPMSPTATTADGWTVFEGHINPGEAGRFGFTVRILPKHPLLLDAHALGLIRWA